MSFTGRGIGDILNSLFIYGLGSNTIILKYGSFLLKKALGSSFVPLKGFAGVIVKKTLFRKFCAGEDWPALNSTIKNLHGFGIKSIVDLSIEDSPDNAGYSSSHDLSYSLIRENIIHSAGLPSPLLAVKISALVPYDILRDVSLAVSCQHICLNSLRQELLQEKFGIFWTRLDELVRLSSKYRVGLMIDAEYLEIQPAIDYLALALMGAFPKNLLSNTYQMYLDRSFDRLRAHLELSKRGQFDFGLKLVRGAYQSSDRGIAVGGLYGSICQTIQETHDQYNGALKYLLNEGLAEFPITQICIASHNDESIDIATKILSAGCSSKKDRVIFAQLLGMADHLSESLVNRGFVVGKYLPYGPLLQSMPYLIRRLEENSDGVNFKREARIYLKQLRAILGTYLGKY